MTDTPLHSMPLNSNVEKDDELYVLAVGSMSDTRATAKEVLKSLRKLTEDTAPNESNAQLVFYDESTFDVKKASLKTVRKLTNGTSVLAADYNITAASGTFVDTGLSVTLPSSGVYFIFCDVRVRLQMSSGTFAQINLKLFNSTDNANVSNSLRRAFGTTSTSQFQVTCPIQIPVSIASAKTIKLYAARDFDGALSSSVIASGATTGYTVMTYIKIG